MPRLQSHEQFWSCRLSTVVIICPSNGLRNFHFCQEERALTKARHHVPIPASWLDYLIVPYLTLYDTRKAQYWRED